MTLIVPAKVVVNYFENGGLLTNLSVSKYLCTGFSLNFYAEDTSGYIVGTYNISD